MKKIAVIALATASVLIMAAEVAQQASEAKPKLDPKSPEMVARRKLSFMKHMGGWLLQPGVGGGTFAVLNAQDKVPGEPVDYALGKIGRQFSIDTAHKPFKGSVTIANADKAVADAGVQAAVFLVANADYPALLGSPEKNWAFVNVTALAADKPDADKLNERVKREVWRGFSLACGGMDTLSHHCPLNAVKDLSDLDVLSTDSFSMEHANEILKHLKLYGITPKRRVTYRNACKEGWAPMPTNEFQLAIWQKTQEQKKQAPSNPLKITK